MPCLVFDNNCYSAKTLVSYVVSDLYDKIENLAKDVLINMDIDVDCSLSIEDAVLLKLFQLKYAFDKFRFRFVNTTVIYE